MMEKGKYSAAEIAKATGINLKTVSYRARKLGYRCSDGIPYDGVKQVVNYPRRNNSKMRPSAVNELRYMLKNDGFKTT